MLSDARPMWAWPCRRTSEPIWNFAPPPSTLKLVVDTGRRPVRGVVDELLASLPVSDLSIVDPPLEQVIGSIYDAPRAT